MRILFKTLCGCSKWEELSTPPQFGEILNIPIVSKDSSIFGSPMKYSFRTFVLDGKGHDGDGEFLIFKEKQ